MAFTAGTNSSLRRLAALWVYSPLRASAAMPPGFSCELAPGRPACALSQQGSCPGSRAPALARAWLGSCHRARSAPPKPLRRSTLLPGLSSHGCQDGHGLQPHVRAATVCLPTCQLAVRRGPAAAQRDSALEGGRGCLRPCKDTPSYLALLANWKSQRPYGMGSGAGGLRRQKTARAEPPMAMNTTDTAEGTATSGSAKCVRASRKPSAALCMPAHSTGVAPPDPDHSGPAMVCDCNAVPGSTAPAAAS